MGEQRHSLGEVIADGGLAIVAGADTTAVALCALIYLLITHDRDMRTVKEELERVFPPGSSFPDVSRCRELRFLDAAM